MRLRITVTLAVLFVAAVLSGCGASGDATGSTGSVPPPQSVADLIRDRCTRCHTIDRIKSADHDRAEWDDTIERMRGRGADVTDADAPRIAEFLAGGGASEL